MTEPNLSLALRLRMLAPALIAMALVGGLAPLGTVLVAAFPPRPTEVGWRFQATSLLLSAGPHVAIAITLIGSLGLVAEIRAAVKGAAIAALIMATAFLGVLPFYALDFLQLRGLRSRDGLQAFTVASIETAVVALILVVVLGWAGVRGLQCARKPDEVEAAAWGGGDFITTR